MSRPWVALLSFALASSLLAGCGSGGTRVEGTVTLDGAPVDGGSISFHPEGGEGKPGGTEIKAGKYAIEGDKGLAPGKYKVVILWQKKTGKEVPNKSDPGTTMDETKQVIPMRYNSKSELTADIKSGTNSGVNFDLKSGGPIGAGASDVGRTKAVGD